MKTSFKNPIEVEPNRINRFIIEFPKEFGIQEWTISSANKPIFTNKWEDIQINFIDIIGSMSPTPNLYKFIGMKRRWFSRKPLFTFTIKSLDPTGYEVDRWTISVKSIKKVEFGFLDYDTDDFQRASLTVEPMNCILEPILIKK